MEKSFETVDWAHRTNIYEVNIRQYTTEGTLNAFAEHIPRLKDMGVDTLWFMPLQPIGQLNRKGTLGSYYSVSDYEALNPEYGSLDDFKAIVEKAHANGMKVLIDWVANHTSWDHVWTISDPDFFSKNESGGFRPPYPDWADVIQLDYSNKDLWKSMIKAMKLWVNEFDIDGFRCDMAHMVPLDFWKEARTEIDEEKKLFWLAETEHANYHEAFDASYTWEFLHAMEAYWRKETGIYGLDTVLHKYEHSFPKNAMRLFFTSNHDENSHSGSEYVRLGLAAKVFAVFCCTWNGIPLIYSGQELPSQVRLMFFERDPIRWSEDVELHDFYKTLLTLHHFHPAMRVNDPESQIFRVATKVGGRVFSFLRRNGVREVLVFLNLSEDELSVNITDERVNGKFREVFTNEITDFDNNRELELNFWEFKVFEK